MVTNSLSEGKHISWVSHCMFCLSLESWLFPLQGPDVKANISWILYVHGVCNRTCMLHCNLVSTATDHQFIIIHYFTLFFHRWTFQAIGPPMLRKRQFDQKNDQCLILIDWFRGEILCDPISLLWKPDWPVSCLISTKQSKLILGQKNKWSSFDHDLYWLSTEPGLVFS